MTDKKSIHITLRHAEALVLFDWLARFNQSRSTDFADQAEERVLFDLEASLEKALVEPFDEDYKQAVCKARTEIRDDE